MRVGGSVRAVAVAAALLLLAVACSGNKGSSDTQAGAGAKKKALGLTGQSDDGSATTAAPSGTPGSATTVAGATGGSAKSSSSRSAGGSSTPLPAPGSSQSTPSGFNYKVADLYPASQDRIGMTDTDLTLCMHAAFALGPAFGNSPDDEQVFWQYLNDKGGVQGRKVHMVFTDDAYTPTGGVQAAQQCAQNNPFLMMSGVGFDTVPAVRDWAEKNKQLYLASFSTENGLYNLKYTFEFAPTVEQFGKVAGNWAGTKYKGDDANLGVVWRNSPNWQGGRDNFKAAATAKGAKIVSDIAVQQNQGDYSSVILQLRQKGAKTVLAWVNVLEFAQLERQAAAQGYFPRWITAAFNLVTDTVGDDVDGSNGHPAAVGLWVTPAYPADKGVAWAGEAAEMEAAYRKYRPSKKSVNDVDWQVWLAFKQVTQLFNDCGRDCSRNKLAGMMLSGYKTQLQPLCQVDFGGRGKGKVGSFALNVMEAFDRSGTPGWKQVATCREDF